MRDTHTHIYIYLPFSLIKKRTIGPVPRRKKQNPSGFLPPRVQRIGFDTGNKREPSCIKHTTGGSNADLIMQDRCFAPLDWTDRTRSGCFSTCVDSCIIREMGREKGRGGRRGKRRGGKKWMDLVLPFLRGRDLQPRGTRWPSIFQKVFQQLACRRNLA